MVQNASVIIKLLIQYPDSLGPGTLGQNLGILAIFQESLSLLSSNGHKPQQKRSRLKHQETIVRFEREHGSLQRKRSSLLNLSAQTANITLTFYSFLVRLLACCASIPCVSGRTTIQSQGSHVIPFLQSLISFDDVDAILSMSLCTHDTQGILPQQKQAVLMFMDRVYGFRSPKFFLHLIKNVFLEDIRINIYLCKVGRGFEVHSWHNY